MSSSAARHETVGGGAARAVVRTTVDNSSNSSSNSSNSSNINAINNSINQPKTPNALLSVKFNDNVSSALAAASAISMVESVLKTPKTPKTPSSRRMSLRRMSVESDIGKENVGNGRESTSTESAIKKRIRSQISMPEQR
ncbi:hypothetical protein TL16_g01327 [Triparma laevis f. inornata]|uniref:Uncharacterized protein n=1 Tax=Triparma laevis f. inornata TaxID=1714386 RepID=A0A9W6ZMC1_9STRA|nr:hypothetical protein TL16_g01327 [Triparma laevis f. inornata]